MQELSYDEMRGTDALLAHCLRLTHNIHARRPRMFIVAMCFYMTMPKEPVLSTTRAALLHDSERSQKKQPILFDPMRSQDAARYP